MAPELDAACECDGYDLERAGHDLYFTIAGHGVGFWSREELARGKPRSLGDRLSDLCGRGEIDLYAEGNADAYVVRFGSLYTTGV